MRFSKILSAHIFVRVVAPAIFAILFVGLFPTPAKAAQCASGSFLVQIARDQNPINVEKSVCLDQSTLGAPVVFQRDCANDASIVYRTLGQAGAYYCIDPAVLAQIASAILPNDLCKDKIQGFQTQGYGTYPHYECTALPRGNNIIKIPGQQSAAITNCTSACVDNGKGNLITVKPGNNEYYCYGATKDATCTVSLSDKTVETNLKTGDQKESPLKPCAGWDVGCILINFGTFLVLGLPAVVVSVILWLLNWIAGTVASILGFLMKAVILATLNIYVVPGKAGLPSAIQNGWEFTRDFANLFFLLFTVFIGLATILRLEKYQMKKTLPMLLIMALLVNFSGVLVGIVVDFSNLLTKFFIERLGTWDGITGALKNLTGTMFGQIGTYFNFNVNPTAYLTTITTPVATLAVMLIFLSILLLALFVAMFVFIARVAVLWILTILAPFAFVSYAIPGAKKFWDEWIQNLISWSIIGIPLSFFLYISSALVIDLGKMDLLHLNGPNGLTTLEGVARASTLAEGITNILGPITVLVIIIYGITFSIKMAPAAAQKIIGFAKGAAIGAATGGAAFVGSRLLSWKPVAGAIEKGLGARPMSREKLNEINSGVTSRWRRGWNAVGFGASKALTGPYGYMIRQASFGVREWNKKQNKEEIEKMEGRADGTDAVGKLALLRTSAMTENQRYAIFLAADKANELGLLSDESVVGAGNKLTAKEVGNAYKRAASEKSERDKKMEKHMRLVSAGNDDMIKELGKIKDAITAGTENATKDGLTADERLLYANLTQKTIAEAKNEEDMKLISKDFRKAGNFQDIVQNFWRGPQLEAGAKEFGHAFVEAVNAAAQERGSDWYYAVERRGGTDANPIYRPRNVDVPRFLASTIAQGLGAAPLEGAAGPAEIKQKTNVAILVSRDPVLEEPARKLLFVRKQEQILKMRQSQGIPKEEISERTTAINKAMEEIRAVVKTAANNAGTRKNEVEQLWSQIEKETKTKRKEIPTEQGTILGDDEEEEKVSRQKKKQSKSFSSSRTS